jgi:hypothetical protein
MIVTFEHARSGLTKQATIAPDHNGDVGTAAMNWLDQELAGEGKGETRSSWRIISVRKVEQAVDRRASWREVR